MWSAFLQLLCKIFLYLLSLKVFCFCISLHSVWFKAGLGNKEEFGQLSLGNEENFCMGGPGMILSRETLIRTAPHIGYCLRHLLTSHEDVEVGRCIARFTGATCTWAYEVCCIIFLFICGCCCIIYVPCKAYTALPHL